MTKLECIQKAYGNNWDRVKDFVSEDGYVEFKIIGHSRSNGMDYEEDFQYTKFQVEVIQDFSHGQFLWRPKELKGIENNNGWIKIFDENKINLPPTVSSKYEVVFHNTRIGYAEYIPNNRWFTEHNDYPRSTETVGITHFRKPIKHELPVY